MFRAASMRLGSYVLYDRLVCDWQRFHMREEDHNAAKERYESIKDVLDADRTPEMLPLDEADRLVGKFTWYHNIDMLSEIIRFIREVHGHTLEPRHYNSLLRVFAYNRDRDNATQLLDVVFSRGSYDAQTYASCIDVLHTLGGQRALDSILKVIEQVEASGQLHQIVVGDTAAERRSPVLSSLLHHVCMCRYSPLAMAVVATWMRALGVQLSAWEYVMIMNILMSRSTEFPTFRTYVGNIDAALETGFASLDAVAARVEAFMASSVSSASVAEQRGLHQLIASARASLAYHGVSASTAVEVGVLNLRVTQLHTHLDRIIEHATRFKGIGPMRHNHADLYHAKLLMHQYLRQHTCAVQAIEVAAKAQARWKARYGDPSSPYLTRVATRPGSTESMLDIDRAEDFAFRAAMLLDVAQSFPEVSLQTRQNVTSLFRQLTVDVEPRTDAKVMGYCAAGAMLLLQSPAEQQEACRSLLQVATSTRSGRVPAITKAQIKAYIDMCCFHPPRNAKMSPKALGEREKWRTYLEARETALALFGSGSHAREMMKTLYYSNNQQPAVRKPEEVERDLRLLRDAFPRAAHTSRPTARGLRVFQTPRTSVPRHLFDEKVENPFPQINLKSGAMLGVVGGATSPRDSTSGGDSSHDPFVPMWSFLKGTSDSWYLNQEDMYSSLARCLIHRLDWEGLVQLSINTATRHEFNFSMDMKVNRAFGEIGDPCGALPFKIASKLFDGRISDSSSQKRHVSTILT